MRRQCNRCGRHWGKEHAGKRRATGRRTEPGDAGIAYAVDENGRYVGVPSLGWEPKNIVNAQAWEVISEDINTQARLVRDGQRSPLAYHLARHLMTVGLAASYVRLPRWTPESQIAGLQIVGLPIAD